MSFATLGRTTITSWGVMFVQRKELLEKLDLIEEQARLTVDALPHLAKERQRLIIALIKQIRWSLAESAPESFDDPEDTIRLPS
jgi:hypothetical protein